MHYVPDSFHEFLPDDGTPVPAQRPSIHYRSAPLYLLTAAVAGLLAANFVPGLPQPAGYSWALWAAVLGGSRILYHTLDELLDGRIGAGLALVIAVAAAVLLGETVTAALVVLITLGGESLDRMTLDRAQAAIRSTFELRPQVARVIRDGTEHDVPVESLAVGETIIIRPGSRVPADGRIESGTSAIDESLLTGEPLPITKSPGDLVFAGTVNHLGLLRATVTRVGSETASARVSRLVSQAAADRPPLRQTADRLAALFLPFVLTAAALTVLGWKWATGEWAAGFRPALAVLVVACPCALVLATPTAFLAALAWLARRGVVTKGSAALERLASVDVIAFDKTGTLTAGEAVVTEIRPVAGTEPQYLLRLAAAAEQHADHPLGMALVRAADERGIRLPQVGNFQVHPGAGVTAALDVASIEGRTSDPPEPGQAGNPADARSITVLVGNRRLLELQGVPLPNERIADETAGQTILFVAADGQWIGTIELQDRERDSAATTLSALKSTGVREIALLTGDRRSTAEATAAALKSVDEIAAELRPEDKARWVADRIRDGRRVAMIGDGVNDAPALATATVGIALGRAGSELAAEAGDLVLLGDPLRPLPELLRLSRALVANVRQSILVFALGWNVVGVLLSAAGVLSPVAAAIVHEVGALAVMLNSLRLLGFEEDRHTPLRRLTRRASSWAEHLTAGLSPTRWVYYFVDHAALLARLAIAIGIVVWLTWNVVRIGNDEAALVTRYGCFETTLPTGLHWRWPPPFERVHRIRDRELRRVAIGFRSDTPLQNQITDGESSRIVDWTSGHLTGDEQAVPAESLMLTGDEVPVELTAEVQYRVVDLREHIFGNAAPLETLRTVAEGELRQLAASVSLDDMLTVGRDEIEHRWRERLQRRTAELQLGVTVLDARLLDVHPPRAVVPAYRDVANALEEQAQLINEAEAYFASRTLAAVGETALERLGHSPTIDEDVWRLLLIPTSPAEEDSAGLLAGEVAGKLLSARADAVRIEQAAAAAAERFTELLTAYRRHAALTATELYWQAVDASLKGRPVTIIDPAAAGRRRLWLNAPELPPPVVPED